MAMKYQLPKKKGPTKVNKVCLYCGHYAEQVHSATVNCPKCRKKGMRTAYGTLGGKPYIPEDDK